MKIWIISAITLCLAGALANADIDQELQTHYERQRFDDAVKLLESHLGKQPDDLKHRVELGNLLAHLGKPDDAIKTLKAGIEEKPEDGELWWYIADFATQQGDDGPTVTRSGGTVQYSPQTLSDEETQKWKIAKYEVAIDAYEKILGYSKDHEDSAELLAKVIVSRGTDEGSLEKLKQLSESFSQNNAISLAYAGAIANSGKGKEAAELLAKILERQPRNVAAYRLLAEVQEKLGESKQATENSKRADFYDWMPPFSSLAYSEKLGAIPAEAEKTPGVVADRFKKVDSKESSEVLAAICFRHIAHGEIENGCFRELEKRDEGDLLVALAQNGSSVCTLRESGASLARMKHPDAYAFLTAMLPQDTRPVWHMNAARSLDLLGDKRAVPNLIKALDPEFKETDRQRSELDASFMGDGPLHARRRAALALGGFDTPKSRAALSSGTKNPEVADACHLALYRITKAKEHMTHTLEALAKDPLSAGQAPQDYLRRIGTATAESMAKEIDERFEEEAKKREDSDGFTIETREENESE